MGMFTKSEVEAMRDRVQGKAPPPTKRRAQVGTGDLAKRKRWEAEMSRGSGYFLALVTKSEANLRDRWDTRKRTKTNREAVWMWLRAHHAAKFHSLPARIKLTRYGKGILDDDNLRPALKAVRDGVAQAFGIDDGNTFYYRWEYDQVKAPHYGVRIEIESL